MDEDLRIAVYELTQRVAALEARLNGDAETPATFAAPTGPVGAAADPEVVGYLRSGKEINAIKVWRERTGLGLAEAKHAIDVAKRDLEL